MTKIKICGLVRTEDIDFVNEALPDYAGFILHFPKSHRNVAVEEAKRLKNLLRPEIRAACVFVNQPLERVIQAAETIGPDVLQLHGSEDNEYIRELKEQTGLMVWKAFRVRSEEDLAKARESAADLVLLDNGYGTGETFDWSQAEAFEREFILAGGLTPENISEAILRLHPLGVDISSGVETDHFKDREKIFAAVRAAHGEGE